jgi:XTP/dITP diphosphohydrolase
MKIVFASKNTHKAMEIARMLPPGFALLTLHDLELQEDIPETADTLEGNAKLKADYVTTHFGLDCFADDTGLEIEALDGAPGVHSAHYAGPQRSDADNMQKVLEELANIDHRSAQFRTVIALNLAGKQYFFEGKVEGEILREKRGSQGFGYDPLFQATGYERSFAEMSTDEKNELSHRARALAKMIDFLHK